MRYPFRTLPCLCLFLCLFLSPPVSARLIFAGADRREVALTFDDGPSLVFTEGVLDILRREKVKATFFVVGRKIEANPWLLRRIDSEGHQLGNHTFNHSKVTWLSDQKLINEISRTSNLITFYTGKKVKYFRPPHGTLSPDKRRLIEGRTYDIVLWSVNADDFYKTNGGMPSAERIARRVLSGVRGGDIILMHDNSKELVAALPGIIQTLKKRGYRFVTVSELMKSRPVQLAKKPAAALQPARPKKKVQRYRVFDLYVTNGKWDNEQALCRQILLLPE